MIVHYYRQFFSGPDSVGFLRPRKLVQLLADRGHEVTVFAGDYNSMDEKTEAPEEYISPCGGSYRVLRLAAPRRMRKNLLARLSTYGCFAVKAVLAGLRLPKPHVVVASIQPLFTGTAGLVVARWRRAPFLLEIGDLWPDALEVKGAVTGWKTRVLHMFANQLYRNAKRIISLTPGIKKELLKKGISAASIDVLPNGFDPDLFSVTTEEISAVRQKYGWNDQFVALYTGTHVEVTAIETIVRAAARLKDRANIRFDLFGDGQTKTSCVRMARDLGLENIHFHDPVPKRQIPAIIKAADIAIMTLFRSSLIHIYFENKFIDYMGAGKPILAAMEGEQAEIIQRWQAGRTVAAFDSIGLAGLVADAAENYEPYRQMGDRGKRLVHERLLLKDILVHYALLIEAAGKGEAMTIPVQEPEL